MTRKLRFAVLGHPIAHSVSPAMHRAAFAALGLPHEYEAIDVPDEAALDARIEELRRGFLAGANVTVPYKVAVLAKVAGIDASAASAGAANTLVRADAGLVAHNTDVAGLADELRAIGGPFRAAAVIGAGGAAAAAVLALSMVGANVIAVTTRSWSSSETLVGSPSAAQMRALRALPCVWPSAAPNEAGSSLSRELRLQWAEIASAADIVVQATSAGMSGGASGDDVAAIVPWRRLAKGALAYDLVYNPPETPFLRSARGHGLRAVSGLGMLARQGARSLALWLNVAPDVGIMREAAERELRNRP